MNGPTFVTGGSGFVGGALLKRLVREGRDVRALVRSEDSEKAMAELGATAVRGDVMDVDSLAAGMAGCDTVFHLAGVNEFCVRDASHMFDVNIRGSVNVVEAAARAGIGRLLYTSSAATLGEEQGTVGKEDSSHRGWFLSNYEESKYVAERAVFEQATRDQVEVVAVNPSSVQGPGRSGGTARILIYFLKGKLKAFVDTRMSIVDVDDCTEGHMLAEEKGAPGERYVLNGSVVSARDALEIVGRITGREEHPRRLPRAAALAGAGAVEAVARVRRKSTPVCREMVRTLLHGHAYNGSRAERELGLSYTPLEETLRRTVEWLEDAGLGPPIDSAGS
jgi:dihydroflavonol-4-reductase